MTLVNKTNLDPVLHAVRLSAGTEPPRHRALQRHVLQRDHLLRRLPERVDREGGLVAVDQYHKGVQRAPPGHVHNQDRA